MILPPALREIAPPFPELAINELESESSNSVVILPPASREIAPPFPELPANEKEGE